MIEVHIFENGSPAFIHRGDFLVFTLFKDRLSCSESFSYVFGEESFKRSVIRELARNTVRAAAKVYVGKHIPVEYIIKELTEAFLSEFEETINPEINRRNHKNGKFTSSNDITGGTDPVQL